MALVLDRVNLPVLGLPVYHFAPEQAIADILLKKFGSSYVPADYSPEEYSWSKVPVRRVDLSQPPKYLPREGLGGMIHSHVFEHIPGSFERVVSEMNETIAPSGFHIFQVPIERGWYREDMDPNLPPTVREERFLQHDHMRVFGKEDFADRCLRLFKGMERIDLTKLISAQDLTNAAIPSRSLTDVNGHTAFVFIKR